MRRLIRLYDSIIVTISGRLSEGLLLLLVRVALAGIFWRSARTKIAEGSFLTMSDTTVLLFENEYGMPYPQITAMIATYAEHLLPILVVLGLFTRVGAAGLLVMTLVIQLFVYPEAWWQVHIIWCALALTLIVRGAGLFSLDHFALKSRNRIAA
jgi:putative oxidoreductase